MDGLRRVGASLLQLARTRLELAGVELQEEVQRAAGLLVSAVLLLAAALAALLIGAAAVLLWLAPDQRPAAALALAVVSGVFAWWQLRRIRSALAARPPLFEQTLATLAADHAALRPGKAAKDSAA